MKALVLLLVACGSSAPHQAPPEGRAHRFQIGALEAYALEDGYFTLPNDGKGLGLGRSPKETGDVLAAAGLARDPIRLEFQPLLVKDGDRVILFDTGTGPDASWAKAGVLPRSLARAGVAASSVTDIFISHAHGDHVGGLVDKAHALAFPAATIHISAPEWASVQNDPDPMIAVIAPKIVTFEPGAQVLPHVKAVATPGHTPGHSAYEIGAAPDTLFYLGDLAHHFIVSVQHPAWSIEFDKDRPAAEAMRQQTLASLAASHARVYAFHFPYPGLGHVVAAGDAFAWQPE